MGGKDRHGRRFCWKTQEEARYSLSRGSFLSWCLSSSLRALCQLFSPPKAALLSPASVANYLHSHLSLPLMLMGALGSLLPSPPTSLTHVPSLHSLLCQTALKSAFSPPFLFSLHIFSVGGLTGLVLSSACHKIPLLKSCSAQELLFCSANEAFSVLSALRLREHTYVKFSEPRPSASSSPFPPFATLLSNRPALPCFSLV